MLTALPRLIAPRFNAFIPKATVLPWDITPHDELRFSGIRRKRGNLNQTKLKAPFLNAMGQLLSAYQMSPPRVVLAQALTSSSLMLEHYAAEDETLAAILFTLRQHQPDKLPEDVLKSNFGDIVAKWITEAEAFEKQPTATLSQTPAMLLASKHMAALEHLPWSGGSDLEASRTKHLDALSQLTAYLPESYKTLLVKLQELKNQPVPHPTKPVDSASPTIALTPEFIKGLRWATRLHKNQSRNTTKTPYVSHLFDVAAQIALHGGSQNAVVAGLLHDGPEDQGGPVVFRLIQKHFDPEVPEIVQDLTQPDDIGDWYAEKRGYISHIPAIKNPQSLIAMAADKYHNIKSLFHVLLLQGDIVWKGFYKGQNHQIWFFQSVLQQIQERLSGHPLVTSTQNILQQLKATAFNQEAKPFVERLLQKFPQYKDLTQLAESLPHTCQRTKAPDGSTQTICPPDRSVLHQQIKDKLYGEFKSRIAHLPADRPKVAHIVTGMMGSGKTTKVVDRLKDKDEVFVIDSDSVKDLIPEYDLPNNDPRLLDIDGIDRMVIPEHNGLGATAIHAESSTITDSLLNDVIANGDSFVISHTGRDMNYDINFMKFLKQQGYLVYLDHIEVPPSMAVERSRKRFHEAKRFTPPERVASLGSLSTDNYMKLRELGLKEGFIDGCSWAYNGVQDGDPPIDIERVSC